MSSQPQPSGCPNWYKRFFAWAMATATAKYEAQMSDRKQHLFQNLQGNILEIGPGAGVNLRYLNQTVRWLGFEPNPYMHPYLRQEAERLGLEIEISPQTLDDRVGAENSVDAVISTLVLCSVPDLSTTLTQILSCLKPGGQFLFIEHVAAAKGTLLRQVQSGVRPLWQVIGDGCCPDRETGAAIEAAGFAQVDYETFEGPVPIPIVKPHIIGIATKAGH